jgi:hypothetical protein
MATTQTTRTRRQGGIGEGVLPEQRESLLNVICEVEESESENKMVITTMRH